MAAALRETQEELGLILSPSNGKIVFSEVGRIKNGVRFSDILDVWLFEYDGSVDLSKATTKEVAQFAWLDRAEIKALFDEKEFVDTLSYFFDTATLNSD